MHTLSHLGLIQISGGKANLFLQGQLTCDVNEITPNQSRLGAHCNPQGRMISFFRLIKLHQDYYLILPKLLIPNALQALKKYAVFFKVELIEKEAVFLGLFDPAPPDSLPQLQDAALPLSDGVIIKSLPNYYLRLIFKETEATTSDAHPFFSNMSQTLSTINWRCAEIQACMPALYPETSEQFLPHELNLPQLNAISFKKGCYTGQEIIARITYRGAKLKTQLFLAHLYSKQPLTAGQDIYSATGRAGRLVDFCEKTPHDYIVLILAKEDETVLFLDEIQTIRIIKQ